MSAAKGTMITAEKRDLDVAMTASDDDRKRTEQSYLRYAGAGVEFFATIIVLTLLGVWLDGRFGTAPVLTIVLTFFGFAAATWNLIRSVLPPSRPPHERDEQAMTPVAKRGARAVRGLHRPRGRHGRRLRHVRQRRGPRCGDRGRTRAS